MGEKRLFNVLREVLEDKYIFRFIEHLGTLEFVIEQIRKSVTNEVNREILQSNSLSCLLVGLNFHKFDGFVETKRKELFLNTTLKKHWLFIRFNKNELNNIIEYKKENKFQRNIIHPKPLHNKTQKISSNNCRVYYVRYLNKIMFGIRGLISLASLVKKECSIFILNNLHLELRVANMYSATAPGAKYLGFVVKSASSKVPENQKT